LALLFDLSQRKMEAEATTRRTVHRVQEITECIKASALWTNILRSVHKARIEEIVCYGLGPVYKLFSWPHPILGDLEQTTNNSLYQLSLLVLLAELLSCDVHYYDPLYVKHCVSHRVMEYFGFHAIQDNEHAKRRVTIPTLFYMPACARKLYENLMEANRKVPWRVAWIGNGINRFGEAWVERTLISSCPVLYRAKDIAEQVHLYDTKDQELYPSFLVRSTTEGYAPCSRTVAGKLPLHVELTLAFHSHTFVSFPAEETWRHALSASATLLLGDSPRARMLVEFVQKPIPAPEQRPKYTRE
jgi:hypothetical protein